MEPVKAIKEIILLPLVKYILRGLVAFNLVLGIGFFTGIARTAEFFIVTNIFTYQFWGALYFAVGIFQLYSLIASNSKLTRLSLLSGLFVQTFWLVALAVRQIENFDGNILLLAIFSLIGYIKFGVYLYLPNKEND